MRRLSIIPLVAVFVFTGTPQTAKAEPVTMVIGTFLFNWAVGQGISEVWDKATGKPNIREMKRQLDALAASDRGNAAEIRWLRDRLSEKMDRAQVQALVMESLTRVDKQLAELAVRMKKAEDRIAVLEVENRDLRDRVTRNEIRTEGNTAKLTAHDDKLVKHDERLTKNEGEITQIKKVQEEHAKRLQALERAVGPMGAEGFIMLDRGQFEKALEKFDEALAKDFGEPGFYYGKGLALYFLDRAEEGKRVIAIGTQAESERPTGVWYENVRSKIQGRPRTWFDTTRNSYLTPVGRQK